MECSILVAAGKEATRWSERGIALAGTLPYDSVCGRI